MTSAADQGHPLQAHGRSAAFLSTSPWRRMIHAGRRLKASLELPWDHILYYIVLYCIILHDWMIFIYIYVHIIFYIASPGMHAHSCFIICPLWEQFEGLPFSGTPTCTCTSRHAIRRKETQWLSELQRKCGANEKRPECIPYSKCVYIYIYIHIYI